MATPVQHLGAVRRTTGLPDVLEVVDSAATIGLILSVGFFVWRVFVLLKRRLLWRVDTRGIDWSPLLLLLAIFVLQGLVAYATALILSR